MMHVKLKNLLLFAVILLLLLLLWRGYSDGGKPTCHHRYFDTQVQSLLSQNMVSPQEFHQIIFSFNKLQTTLRTRWQDAELFAYGSLFIGLGTKTSDIDYYLKIPNYNDTADKYIVQETAKLLYEEPERYNSIVLWLNVSVPMMSFYDTSLQRNSDLSFRNSHGIQNTKLIAYYMNLDKRYLLLTAVFKFWCKIRHLTGKRELPNYTVYLMVIFYLQQKNMCPPGRLLQTEVPPEPNITWNMNFIEIPYSIENNESLYDLLGGFFKFYSDFNFTEYCVSGYVGRPISKKDLEDINRIPAEFSVYKSYLMAGQVKPLLLHKPMCVQDIFIHNKNVATRVDEKCLTTFIHHINLAVKLYDELPCDKFLEEILSK